MVNPLHELHPQFKWPVFWGLMGLLCTLLAAESFRRAYMLRPENYAYVEVIYDGYEMYYPDQTYLDKAKRFAFRSRSQNQTLIVYTRSGKQIWFNGAWQSCFETLKDPGLKTKRLKVYFEPGSPRATLPVRLEIEGKLIDDKTKNRLFPWLATVLGIFCFTQLVVLLKRGYNRP
ncbi:MAG: hypothetical protein ACK417_12590 [Bacteroidia bacterium]